MNADAYTLVATDEGHKIKIASFVATTDAAAQDLNRSVYAHGLDALPWRLLAHRRSGRTEVIAESAGGAS